MTIEVTNYILHEDISILEMAEAVPLDKYSNIKPICLPDNSADFTDYVATTTGWAYNGVNGYNSWLHENYVTVSENGDKTKLSGKIANNSACYGDMGGPLVVSDPANNNGLTLAGVSDNNDCKTFTKVSMYTDWITSVIDDSNLCPSPP